MVSARRGECKFLSLPRRDRGLRYAPALERTTHARKDSIRDTPDWSRPANARASGPRTFGRRSRPENPGDHGVTGLNTPLRVLYGIVITVAVGSALGRIFSAQLLPEPSQHRDERTAG